MRLAVASSKFRHYTTAALSTNRPRRTASTVYVRGIFPQETAETWVSETGHTHRKRSGFVFPGYEPNILGPSNKWLNILEITVATRKEYSAVHFDHGVHYKWLSNGVYCHSYARIYKISLLYCLLKASTMCLRVIWSATMGKALR